MFPEPVKIATTQSLGDTIKLIGEGLHTGQFHSPSLTPEQLALLEIVTEASYDGDPSRFRLGIEALRLKLAYEYDPYFSLSIARIDPLPHQLEAVYEHFIKLPRIRFLLADDPGAGKTIMAGLLIKELKIRGLVKRILIVTPANLTFQWQREMHEKFHESFDVIRGAVLRETYGTNPWQERHQAITSIAWISRIADAKESLLRSHWDLVIVDEAHKMSAYSAKKKTMAYQLGEALSGLTDHYLLMTATPHKGDPTNFALFLSLLDKDVYGDVSSLEEAMMQHEAPFYLRRVKEALVTFPDAETGDVKALFTRRNVQTAEFRIDEEEWEFYDNLTKYVEDQSIRAAQEDSNRARAIGFTMAMLQRRFASSVYAVRRSLERMKKKREKILADPERYRQEQIRKKLPDDFDELPEEEQLRIIEDLEEVVASIDPADLQEEILQLEKLIRQADTLQRRETETKLLHLKEVLTAKGVFSDPDMKLLIFTEHKDTLDYLAGDGQDGRPYGKLQEWGLTVTQIHGGMKVGDRDTPGTRIYAEREFRESCQVMVATEAAGEGINLQFCWFLINYDIPWNPIRLEQRMGRIHRYGQDKDCLIINFVAVNTSEGKVLQKLFERIQRIEFDLDPQRTGKVFNVLGDIFSSNQLERMIRDMYAHNLTEEVILSRIVEEVDTERFRRITHSTLEGLAKRELNLSAMIGKTAEAKEKRLVPEVIADFFLTAAPVSGITPKPSARDSQIYRIGRLSRPLREIGTRLEPRFGRLGREYKQIAFDKTLLRDNPALEWVTPGHPLFEAIREYIADQTQDDVRQGAVFYDLHRQEPSRVDVYSAAIKDGRGNTLHERLFVVETGCDGASRVQQPTLFLDVIPATGNPAIPERPDLPDQQQIEQVLLEEALHPLLEHVSHERQQEVDKIARHVEI
ncbi:helicase, partial [candidate division KSB3 bacterium]|nr:helicase [candidate division KSB3 bacterium]MBD3325420.1 helicase [candidate division KSB3 bacterium]